MRLYMIIVHIALWALAGLIATQLMKSRLSLLWNIILGIVGGAVGSFIAGLIGIQNRNTFGHLIISVAGACLVIWLARLVLPKLKKR